MIDPLVLRNTIRQLGETPTVTPPANDRKFGSLIMLAVTAGAFLLVTWVAIKGLFFLLDNCTSIDVRMTPPPR